MSKEAFYFSHDYGARNDPKLVKVLMKLGHAGKGVYWDLIEMLYEQRGKLSIDQIDSYAFALRADSDCIKALINDFELFNQLNGEFWSESVNRRLEIRRHRSEKAAQSAQIRWKNANASNNDTNALQVECDGNAIKDNILKDNDNIKNIYPTELVLPVINYLNNKTEKKFKPNTPGTIKLILARQKDGFGLDDFKKVIDNKVKCWLTDNNNNKYLRPETLFGPKFESYLNERVLSKAAGGVVY